MDVYIGCGIQTLTYVIKENLCLNILHALFKNMPIE